MVEIKTNKHQETKKSSQKPRILLFLLIITFWVGLIYGAGYYTKQYIDYSIQTVQQTNAMNARAIEDRLELLSNNLQEIKDALQDTDQTISSSDSIQKELTNRITELDKQLKELQHSLAILKEAP